jgi:hypothetical protein
MTDIDAGRLWLRPIGRDAARAVLDGRPPSGVTLAPGYPSPFSLEVMEMVASARPGASDGYGPYFMVRKADDAVVGEVDGERAELVVYQVLADPLASGDGRVGAGPQPAGGL